MESLVAIALMGVLMAALTPYFAGSISFMSRQRATQAATQVATTAVEKLRSLAASDLVTGHDSTSVTAQFAAAPTAVQPYLTSTLMTPAVDTTAASGAGATATIPTAGVTQTPDTLAFTVTTYLGRCNIPAGGSSSDCAAATTSDSVEYLRAVVAVTWALPKCPTGGCSYVTATLLSATGDPTFNLKEAPPPVPVPVSPGNQVSTAGTAITPVQMAVQTNTGVPTMTWGITAGALPAGIAMGTSGLISGTPTTVQAATAVTITVTDAFLRQASVTFTWTVLAPPTVVSPGNQRHSVGSAVSVAMATTCPSAPCTYTLTGGPPGLSVTAAGVITGTITGAAQVYSPVTATVTDANGATATTAAFSWTVLAAPTVTPPSAQTTTTGATVSLTLGSTCPNTACTYALNNGPAGLTISSSGVVSGIVTSAAQTFSNVTVTITDASGSAATTAAFTWTVLAKPTVTTPAAQTTTTGATVSSLAVATTCPNSPCTYTLTNAPAGLSISSSGVISGTITSAAQVFTSVTVTVRDAAGVSVSSDFFTWTVLARPTVTAPAAQSTATGASVSLTLTKTCPNSPCTYVLNNGPAGLSVTSAGVVTGTVTSAAQVFSRVSVTVTDAGNQSTTSDVFTWTITSTPVTATNPGTQKSTRSTAITPLQLTSTGGSGSVTWSVTSSLPAGLSLNSSTGKITGTPTTTGTTSVTVKATDTVTSATSSVTFSWTVVAAPTVSTSGLVITSTGSVRSVAVTYTCPYASCTITVDNEVPGVGLSTSSSTSTNNTNETLTVTATSGTVYLAGTVQSSAAPNGVLTVWTPDLVITDGAGATATATGTWYVLG